MPSGPATMLLLFALNDGLIRTFFAGEVVVTATVNERLFFPQAYR